MSGKDSRASRRRATVLFVEDELSILEEFTKILERDDYRVLSASHPSDVLKIMRKETRIDLAVMDLQLPMEGCSEIGLQEAAGGRRTGLVLGRELRKTFKRIPIIFWSGAYDKEVRPMVLALGNARLVPKAAGPEPVLDIIRDILDGFRSGTRPRTFIVHGHDHNTMLQFKNYLQNTLRFPEPIVLREMPSHGKTVIEKLETYAYATDVVFVLLTPDDRVVDSSASETDLYRSRQNVIFELGYFLGALGRTSGRVILLHRGPVDLPSDIGGIVSIDISEGIDAADREIREELREWL